MFYLPKFTHHRRSMSVPLLDALVRSISRGSDRVVPALLGKTLDVERSFSSLQTKHVERCPFVARRSTALADHQLQDDVPPAHLSGRPQASAPVSPV